MSIPKPLRIKVCYWPNKVGFQQRLEKNFNKNLMEIRTMFNLLVIILDAIKKWTYITSNSHNTRYFDVFVRYCVKNLTRKMLYCQSHGKAPTTANLRNKEIILFAAY